MLSAEHKGAFSFVLSALALPAVHGVLPFCAYGNRPDGTFTMTAFFHSMLQALLAAKSEEQTGGGKT